MANKPGETPSREIKLAPYAPGLYTELILAARFDVRDDEPRPRIDRLTLEFAFSTTIHD
jgi:hypothetical protein